MTAKPKEETVSENRIRPVDVKDIHKDLKRRKAQVAAGERLLQAITDSRHPIKKRKK